MTEPQRPMQSADGIGTSGREPAWAFYKRLSAVYGCDIDLDALVRQDRQVHAGPDLCAPETPLRP